MEVNTNRDESGYECGCAETESSKVVGWCLHCDHLYVSYGPEIEDRHFSDNCPDASRA